MHKTLLLGILFTVSTSLIAQNQKRIEATAQEAPQELSANQSMMPVNDTLLNPIFNNSGCDPRFYTYTIGNGYITGTVQDSSTTIDAVGQLSNVNDDTFNIHSMLVAVTHKAEGPTPGSFKVELYDTTTGSIASTPFATTQTVSVGNIDTSSGNGNLNEFSFGSPVRVNKRFWTIVDVSNNSDTLAVYSTNENCGNGTAILRLNGSWTPYSATFTTNGNPLDISLFIWATVDTNTVGLPPQYISKDGLDFYPNPAEATATIEFDMPQQEEVTLYVQDMTGRDVMEKTIELSGNENKFDLNISQLESGYHTYQVVGDNAQLNGVFMKE